MSEGLWKIESHGMMVDRKKFKISFPDKIIDPRGYVYTEYNLFTSTGRPSNRFGGVNFAALNKTDGSREPFISRYGKDGKLIMIDYSAYHPHLIAQLINYNLPTDVYSYLGKYYYSKENLTEYELSGSKLTTFQLLYGHIPDKYLYIPYFKKINEYIHNRWDYFTKHGYVDTPVFKRRITNIKLKEPSPAKLFNYIIQASETEYNMEMLVNVNSFCNNKKIAPILYTYDSLLFDVHNDDADFLELKNIMSYGKFPVKCYSGDNYNKMELINII
jgi:DNA polymerase I-like protein with 3'-5' exonuclease and polymerase domains